MVEAWMPLAVAALSAGPAWAAVYLRKIHKQVNGQDETLSTIAFKTMQTVARVEQKLDQHLTDHERVGDGR
mgnify:CR=1 FL=1